MGSPHKGTVMQHFDMLFVVHLINLCNEEWGLWFEKSWRCLCDDSFILWNLRLAQLLYVICTETFRQQCIFWESYICVNLKGVETRRRFIVHWRHNRRTGMVQITINEYMSSHDLYVLLVHLCLLLMFGTNKFDLYLSKLFHWHGNNIISLESNPEEHW